MEAGLNDFSPSHLFLLIIQSNSLPPSVETKPLKIFPYKQKRRAALCQTIGEGLPHLPWEHNYSSYKLSGKGDFPAWCWKWFAPVDVRLDLSAIQNVLPIFFQMGTEWLLHTHIGSRSRKPIQHISAFIIYQIKAHSGSRKKTLCESLFLRLYRNIMFQAAIFISKASEFENKVTCFLDSLENFRGQSSLPVLVLLSILKL